MFYIYEWFIVETGEIIYVGKGTGNRYKAKKKNKKLNYILAHQNCNVRIIERFDTEDDAFKAESKRISELKNIGQCVCNNDRGGWGGKQSVWTEERRATMSKNNPMKDESQKQRMSEDNPMKSRDIALAVGKTKKRPVVINGKRCDGIRDAAREFGVAEYTILKWVKRGYDTDGNPCRYEDSEQIPYERKKYKWSKRVLVDGVRYESVKDAAEYLGCWSETVIRCIKNNRLCNGHKVEYDNQQPSHGNQ